MKIKRLNLSQRGVSEIISGLIMISALFGFTTFVLVHKARQGQMQAEGLIDVMREAEERQSQLIDFLYAEERGGDLHVYISNYGWENAAVERGWVAGESVTDWNIYTVDGTPTDNVIPRESFVEMVVRDLPSGRAEEYAFAFLTESNSIYKWMVHR